MPPRRRSTSRKRRQSTPKRARSTSQRNSTPQRASTTGSKTTAAQMMQPRTTTYEWGGPVGGIFLVVFLPLLVLGLNSLCTPTSCAPRVENLLQLPTLIETMVREAIPALPKAVALEVAWLLLHAVFSILPIGKCVKGLPLRDGTTLTYRMNAIHACVLSHVLIFALHYTEIIRLEYLADLYPSLMLGSILISIVFSVALYILSFRSPSVMTALGGNSGNPFYDFWIGRELNPRTGPLDWKLMCELRPGLIGWSVLNWAFVAKAMALGSCTPSVVLVALFETLYVVDGLLLEAGNLTMMDIVTDGFGYMLCFGDLTWVPFIYTLQTKYLAYHPVRLPIPVLLLFVCLILGGYALFRGANTEKDRYRTNPKDPRVRHLHVMKTSAGKSLIVSGYWGTCRHPNYVGDWLMALGWASLTGFSSPIPFFHPIYFGILLMHRQLRDEQHMLEKYGKEDWEAFCHVVRYRLIPYVY